MPENSAMTVIMLMEMAVVPIASMKTVEMGFRIVEKSVMIPIGLMGTAATLNANYKHVGMVLLTLMNNAMMEIW